MIRKAIIIVLTLGAVGTASITTISIWMPLAWLHDLNDLTTACYVIKGGVLKATYRPNPKQVSITTGCQRQVPSSLILLPRTLTRLGAKSTPRGSFLSLPALRHRTSFTSLASLHPLRYLPHDRLHTWPSAEASSSETG